MDEVRRLASVSDPGSAVGVVGRGEDFFFVDLNKPVEAAVTEGIGCGFNFAGIIATVSGEPRAGIVPGNPEHAVTMSYATLSYARRMVAEAQAERARVKLGDSVDWLERLHSLPDGRVH